jgi:hypothetical protein
MRFIVGVLMVAGLALAQERFDMLVREDFFAGIQGDSARFAKAMKVTEDTLAREPKHAEAKVWHGSGVLFRAGQEFARGDYQNGLVSWENGLKEMDEGVGLAPSSVGVLIPRGASLIAMSRFAPPDVAKPILETGVGDYEKVLKIQEPMMARMSAHSKGELLIALADGWNRLGNAEKAKQYFERILSDLKGTVYEQKAQAWLQNKPESKSPEFFNCSGCHVK